jgi:hypothetical protein
MSKSLTDNDIELLEMATYSYGFLVPMHKTYTAEEWIVAIGSYYEQSDRVKAIIDVIYKASN